jgi:hypothetical protein
MARGTSEGRGPLTLYAIDDVVLNRIPRFWFSSEGGRRLTVMFSALRDSGIIRRCRDTLSGVGDEVKAERLMLLLFTATEMPVW